MSGFEAAFFALVAATSTAAAYSSYQTGQYNEKVQKNQAKQERIKAEVQAADIARRTRLQISKRRAAAAARGVEFTGSALDLAAQDAIDAELNQRYTAYGGQVTAVGLEAAAKQSAFEGTLGAGTTLLQGASTITRARMQAAPTTGTT